MALTANDILTQAVQRSNQTNPDLIPVSQVLQYISRDQDWLMLRAARLNPDYFGASGSVTTTFTAADTHKVSANLDSLNPKAGAVVRAEVKAITGSVSGVSAGDPIRLVNFRNPEMQVAPRAFIRGRTLYGYKTDLGADALNYVSQITVYYSKVGSPITSLSSTISIPDEFANILVLRLARRFAIRDGRFNDLEGLKLELDEELRIFDEGLFAYEAGATRVLAAIPAVPLPPIQP